MMIKKQVVDDREGASLKMFAIEIWLQLVPVLAFFFTFFLLLTIVPVRSRIKRARLISYCLLDWDYAIARSTKAVSLITLFYCIYFMTYKSIISNNIKTNSLIVNSGDLIDSHEDLLATKRFSLSIVLLVIWV